jgi:phenylacetate-CoA ligase
MTLNLTVRPLNANAYSDRPFTFIDHAALKDLANITAISLLENGDRIARETWQNRQLTNLLKHAHTRSKFWRQRMPSRIINHTILKYLPVQTREDVAKQANLEGSLAPSDRRADQLTYASTGSTGTPVQVFVTAENGYYNAVRSLAQYFINDLSLDESRVHIATPRSLANVRGESVRTAPADSWAGPLSQVFRNRPSREIMYKYDDEVLIDELLKAPGGYLNCASRYMEILINRGGADLIKRLGIKLWLHHSDYRNPSTVNVLKNIGVHSLSNYSAGEVGPIAFECFAQRGYFHVAHSNVIVECDNQLTTSFNGVSVSRLLVTNLHSYATPIIRYDVGDFGQLEQNCRCGHDGPTISNIFGRGKHFVRLPNGSFRAFNVSTPLLQEIVAFKECRITQPDINTISVQIGGRENLTIDEREKLKEVIIKASDPAFTVEIKAVREINWEGNPKRLFFSNAVA